MSEEDRLVGNAISYFNDGGHYDDMSGLTYDIEPEAHYNYYGDRGVVDLAVRENIRRPGERSYEELLMEVKSGQAVSSATGANEITRQFNKMRRYYYKDEDRGVPDDYTFELCFLLTEQTIEHVAENISIYETTVEQDLGPENWKKDEFGESRVVFRLPNKPFQSTAYLLSCPTVSDVLTPAAWKESMQLYDSLAPKVVASILDDLGY